MKGRGFYLLRLKDLEFSKLEDKKVRYSDKCKIEWTGTYSIGTNNYEYKLGTSLHTLYVTSGKPPDGAPAPCKYRTVYHIGCNNANGKTDDADIFLGIWNYLSKLKVKRYDDTPSDYLKYWNNKDVATTEVTNLLRTCDGKCGAWAQLMQDCLSLQHIKVVNMTVYPYALNLNRATGRRLDGVSLGVPETTKAQGDKRPSEHDFKEHALIVSNGKFFDPSYGTGEWTSFFNWQDKCLQYVSFKPQAGGPMLLP